MDDVGPGKTVTEAQVSVPGDADGELAHPASWQVVAERADRKRRQIRRVRVEPVALRLQEDDVEAVGEVAPRAQVPRVGLMPPDENHARLAHDGRRARSQTFRRTIGSRARAPSVRGRRFRRVWRETMPIPGITDS